MFCASGFLGHLTGFTLPIVAYFNRDYSWMHVTAAALSSLALPTYFFIPESCRWLACNRKCERAETILMVSAN